MIVVFDGYSGSPKDNDHIRRTKNSCCDLQIRPDMIYLTMKAKFLDNTHNKSQLILLFSTFRKYHIITKKCDNDADTSIVREALAAAGGDSVEVRAEDADVLVMLMRHSSNTNHSLFLPRRMALTISERSETLFMKERGAVCSFVTHSLAVIQF